MNKLLGVVGTCLLLASCNTVKNNDILEINDKSKYVINAKVNEKVTFAVEANVTTGYNWVINIDSTSKDVKLISEEYKSFPDTPKDIVGAPVNKIYVVEPLKSGQHSLKLVYKRGWENNDGINTKEVVLKVSEK